MTGRVTLAELAPDELDELAGFLSRQSAAAGEDFQVTGERLRWLLVENPARRPDIPLGWIARERGGSIVGAKLCAPQRFECLGRGYTLAMGGGWYVAASHRGIGFSLFRRFLALSQRYALFSTTLNEESGRLYDACGGYAIPDTDHEWLVVLRWTPVLEDLLSRRLGWPGPARVLARVGAAVPAAGRSRGRGGELVAVGPDELESLRGEAAVNGRRRLAPAREPAFLHWRYFSAHDDSTRLYRFQAGSEGSGFVAVNRTARGKRGQIRALNVLDLWGGLSAGGVAALIAALAVEWRTGCDVIVLRGQPRERWPTLRAAGGFRRKLPRPLAVCIDPADLLPTRDWDLVPAEGDMGTFRRICA